MPDFVGIFERRLDTELEVGLLGTFLLKETMARTVWRKRSMGFNLIQICVTAYVYNCSEPAILWSAFLGSVSTRGTTSSRALIRM